MTHEILTHTLETMGDVAGKPSPKRPEQALHQAVVNYLRVTIPRTIWFHVPNGAGNRGGHLGGILKGLGVRAGVADLVFVLPDGRAAFLELKAPKGRQSVDQQIFQADCERLGIPYAVCRTLPEVEGTLLAWNLILRGRIAA